MFNRFLTRALTSVSVLLLFFIVNCIFSVIVHIKERINKLNKHSFPSCNTHVILKSFVGLIYTRVVHSDTLFEWVQIFAGPILEEKGQGVAYWKRHYIYNLRVLYFCFAVQVLGGETPEIFWTLSHSKCSETAFSKLSWRLNFE